MLLGYTVAKAPASPRNSTWFTRPFLLVRGYVGSGDETRRGQSDLDRVFIRIMWK